MCVNTISQPFQDWTKFTPRWELHLKLYRPQLESGQKSTPQTDRNTVIVMIQCLCVLDLWKLFIYCSLELWVLFPSLVCFLRVKARETLSLALSGLSAVCAIVCSVKSCVLVVPQCVSCFDGPLSLHYVQFCFPYLIMSSLLQLYSQVSPLLLIILTRIYCVHLPLFVIRAPVLLCVSQVLWFPCVS